ncbi:helix-turn-helix domain-containing protein [Demequina capsici]|uniref:Helix-turn-helix domain-containing protein n=1 Tax=Demequina capsici TaxID=3075620 RepID=A0AA96FH56_9MICO|nr:helix-turn-helix domain-containing protein [Demequina sp. PMTSA13]WNM28445.1 helix-turn-helix domain-containing protein [Demequina sp. PMTSA13]
MGERLLNEFAVEEWTGVPVNTLRWFRHCGDRGPAYLKIGRSVRYRENDVQAWLDAARVPAGSSDAS